MPRLELLLERLLISLLLACFRVYQDLDSLLITLQYSHIIRRAGHRKMNLESDTKIQYELATSIDD